MKLKEPQPSRTAKLQRLYAQAVGQAGYFTAAQAADVGYSHRSLVHHVAAGHFERVARGLYRLAGLPADSYDDVVAVWLKHRGRRAVVSHDTALALHDLAPSRSTQVHLTVPRARRPRSRQASSIVRLHTTTAPLRRHEVTSRFGVTLTSPARTIVDVAAVGGDPSLVVEAASRALATGLLTPAELEAASRNRGLRVRRVVERALEEARSRA